MEKVCVIFRTSESFCASWRHGCLSSPRKFICRTWTRTWTLVQCGLGLTPDGLGLWPDGRTRTRTWTLALWTRIHCWTHESGLTPFCRDDHGFGFLSIGLQEVCSEPAIDLVDVLLESFEVRPAVDRFILGGVIGI